MDSFNFNKGIIKYKELGSDDPIVFIHGFGLDSRMWEPQIDCLKYDHKLITYDLRGFGESSVPSCPYSHYEDLKAFLNYLDIKKTKIVGFSFGGEVAVDFTIANPSYVNSLVLIGSSLGGYVQSAVEETNFTNRFKGMDVKNIKAELRKHPAIKSIKSKPKIYELVLQMLDEYSCWHYLNEDPIINLVPPANTRLNEIKCPVQIILGGKDSRNQHEIADKLLSCISDSKLCIVRGAGHFVTLEKPDTACSLIRNL